MKFIVRMRIANEDDGTPIAGEVYGVDAEIPARDLSLPLDELVQRHGVPIFSQLLDRIKEAAYQRTAR